MSSETRLLAVRGGGDWYDASVDHIVAPAGLDIDAARKRHQEWYQAVYMGHRSRGETVKYLSFPEWLIEHEGCSRATDEDVLEVWDGP